MKFPRNARVTKGSLEAAPWAAVRENEPVLSAVIRGTDSGTGVWVGSTGALAVAEAFRAAPSWALGADPDEGGPGATKVVVTVTGAAAPATFSVVVPFKVAVATALALLVLVKLPVMAVSMCTE